MGVWRCSHNERGVEDVVCVQGLQCMEGCGACYGMRCVVCDV